MSPSTAGTTDAAMLGVLLAYLLLGNQTRMVQMVFAFIFALTSTILFMTILSRIQLRDAVYVPLIGICLLYTSRGISSSTQNLIASTSAL